MVNYTHEALAMVNMIPQLSSKRFTRTWKALSLRVASLGLWGPATALNSHAKTTEVLRVTKSGCKLVILSGLCRTVIWKIKPREPRNYYCRQPLDRYQRDQSLNRIVDWRIQPKKASVKSPRTNTHQMKKWFNDNITFEKVW